MPQPPPKKPLTTPAAAPARAYHRALDLFSFRAHPSLRPKGPGGPWGLLTVFRGTGKLFFYTAGELSKAAACFFGQNSV